MRKKNVHWVLILYVVVVCSVSQVVIGAASVPTPRFFGEKWGFINTAGKISLEPRYDRLGDLSGGLAAVRVGQYEGFIDKNGRIVIEPKFAAVGDFSEGLARANLGGTVIGSGELRGGKWGYMNRTGELTITPVYGEAGDFRGGLAPVKAFDRWGYIDAKGKIVIQFVFEYARNFSDGLAFVVSKGKVGYINPKMGGPLSPWENHLRYEQYGDFQEGLAPVLLKERWGFINKQGALAIPCQFSEVKGFTEDLAAVRVGTRWGYINKKGQVVIRPQYRKAGSFSKGLTHVEFEDGSRGYIRTSGEIAFKISFEGLYDFSEGLARVHVPAGWGYVDKSNKMVIEPRFDLASPFSEGLAYAATGERIGYINPAGDWVIQPKFAGGSEFKTGLALVAAEKWKETTLHWIDNKGKVVKTFDEILREGSKMDGHLLQGQYAVVSPAGLKMRKQPNPKSEQVGMIPYGKKVKVVSRTRTAYASNGIVGNWILVEYNRVKGYVFDGFLSRLAAPDRDNYSDLGEYLGASFGERKIKTVWFSSQELMNITFGSSGMVALLAGVAETDNASLVYWLPGVTMREIFLLMQNLVYKDNLVMGVNDKPLSTPIAFSALDFPGEMNQIKLEMNGDGWEYSIWLEKEKYGYIKVIEG